MADGPAGLRLKQSYEVSKEDGSIIPDNPFAAFAGGFFVEPEQHEHAAITRGVQSMEGVGTTIKHFACNNQEDNRMGSDSILSQRALREIYLRGFEIAVKESQPMAIMTSYNLINGVHTANSKDLCTKVARHEWGFAGIIMTDWTTTTKKGGSQSWLCVQAGNDLIMPGSSEDYENIRRALRENRLKKEELKSCACRMIVAVIK